MEIKNNGLHLHAIKSTITPVHPGHTVDLESLVSGKISGNAFVVAYLDYKVLIGRYADNTFQFYNKEKCESKYLQRLRSKYLQRLRVFNETQEFLAWRTGDGFMGRYREDDEGNEVCVVDAHQVLFGTRAEKLPGGYTQISETRGTELVLPFAEIGAIDEGKNRVCIKTRNYIGYTETGQATYTDCRFMAFTDYQKKVLE